MSDPAHPDAPLMLTVSGVRGIVGKTMTPEVAENFAAAFGAYIKAASGRDWPLLCFGRDSRPSGAELSEAVAKGLARAGCDVVDLGVVATPTVGVMIGQRDAAGGMVVTASHNPNPWNGLKCLNADGVAPPPDVAAQIIRTYQENQSGRVDPGPAVNIAREDMANEIHVARVLDVIESAPIRARKFKVMLDSVNGAGCVSGRMILDHLDCRVIHLNGEPTGEFAHTPEPTKANLTELAERMKSEDAAVGFAQDPDADRLAIVDENGSYIGEEYTLVLAAKRILDMVAATSGGGVVVATNLSTSRMIDDLAARYVGVEVVRTAVGEANVVEALKQAGDRGLIGGEGNGGVILPRVCWVRDSLSSMAMVLSLLAAEGRPLSEIVADLPHYVMIKKKYDLSTIGGRDAVGPMLEKVKKHYAHERINDADGVRVDVADGWVHLRPSNTEPIVRLIAEAKEEYRVWALIDEVSDLTSLT